MKNQRIFKIIPFLILLFPIILVFYIIIFEAKLEYKEDIIINKNINTVIKLHEDTSFLQNYMIGFVRYDVISGKLRDQGSVAEITMIFNPQESVSRKIKITEKIILNNLPNKKVIIHNSGATINTFTYKFTRIGKNKTQFSRSHNYKFNTYMKVSSFFLSKKIKRRSYEYLTNFKVFVENY